MRGQGLKELAHQLGVEIADLGAREFRSKTRNGRPDRSTATRVKVSSIGRCTSAKRLMPRAVAQRLPQSLAERDAGILDRVMRIDMQVALGRDLDVDQRMAGELLQHMIEKADAGRNLGHPRAVEIDADFEVRLLGLAGEEGVSHGLEWVSNGPGRVLIARQLRHGLAVAEIRAFLGKGKTKAPKALVGKEKSPIFAPAASGAQTASLLQGLPPPHR